MKEYMANLSPSEVIDFITDFYSSTSNSSGLCTISIEPGGRDGSFNVRIKTFLIKSLEESFMTENGELLYWKKRFH